MSTWVWFSSAIIKARRGSRSPEIITFGAQCGIQWVILLDELKEEFPLPVTALIFGYPLQSGYSLSCILNNGPEYCIYPVDSCLTSSAVLALKYVLHAFSFSNFFPFLGTCV